MLTLKELDEAENYIDRPGCVWHFTFNTTCSNDNKKIRYSYRKTTGFIQPICSKHLRKYKAHFKGIIVKTLSAKEIFYIKIKC